MRNCNSLGAPVADVYARYVTPAGDKNQPFRGPGHLGLPVIRTNGNPGPMINPEIIKSYGGKEVHLKDGETIFLEGAVASHYFQVAIGSIKMLTISPDGKEFIQGIFNAGDSFGEPPLFCEFPYPSAAYAIGPCTVLKLQKEKLFTLLRENFDIHLLLDRILCQRLRYKSMVLSEISSYDPEHRILTLLKYLKSEGKPVEQRVGLARTNDEYIVPFTRQQLADMSGLRVETVIRTVKKMDREGKLQLKGRKIAL